MRWWTWAGHRTNATLAATLGTVAVPAQHINDRWIRLREDITARTWSEATRDVTDRLCLPDVDERAVRGLKFGEALPLRLAEATLAARWPTRSQLRPYSRNRCVLFGAEGDIVVVPRLDEGKGGMSLAGTRKTNIPLSRWRGAGTMDRR
jgi:hypothetical protein